MERKSKYTQQQMADTLRDTKGMVYLTAQRLGCTAQTVYNYIQRYPAVREASESSSGLMSDTAELKLYQAIMAGEAWAIAFYLKTKGKSRGYVERQEVTGKDGEAIQNENKTTVDLSGLSVEQLKAFADHLKE